MRKMWVLKDFENNYITANRCFILTDEGWLYGTFSGRTTGFSYYSDKSIAVK